MSKKSKGQKPQRFEPMLGTTLKQAAGGAATQASVSGEPVTLVFGGAETVVEPGTTEEEVATQARDNARRLRGA